MGIKFIVGDEPKRDGEYPICHHVGYDGVTSITETIENLGDYDIRWFNVWCGENEIARMNARYVVEIRFEKAIS